MHIFHKWSEWSLPKYGYMESFFIRIDCIYKERFCPVCGKCQTKVVG